MFSHGCAQMNVCEHEGGSLGLNLGISSNRKSGPSESIMKPNKNPFRLIYSGPFLGWILLALTTACGGGGGGTSSPASQPPLTPSTLVLLSALPSAGGVQLSLSYGKTGTQPIHLAVDTGIGTPVLLQDSFKPPQASYFLALPTTSEYRITLDQGLAVDAEIRSTIYDAQKVICKNTQVLDFPIAAIGYASWMTATDPDHLLCINAVQGYQMNIIRRMGGLFGFLAESSG